MGSQRIGRRIPDAPLRVTNFLRVPVLQSHVCGSGDRSARCTIQTQENTRRLAARQDNKVELGPGANIAGGRDPSAQSPGAEALVGRVLGNFTLQRLLGEGGPSYLFRAQHRFQGTTAAVRVVVPHASATEAHREAFLRRARSLLPLRNPHLASLHEYGTEDGLYYWALEYVQGSDLDWALAAYSQGSQLAPADDVRHVIGQLSQAVDYLHGQGILHGNLKPSNVLLDRRLRVVVTDLAMDPDDAAWGTHPRSSAGFLAPERHSARAATAQSDLYSLGAILCRMLLGALPDEPAMASEAEAALPPVSRLSLERGLSPSLESVLLRALAVEPDQRFASGWELEDAVKPALSAVATVPSDAGPSARAARLVDVMAAGPGRSGEVQATALAPPKEPGRRDRRSLVLGLGVASLLGAVCAAMWVATLRVMAIWPFPAGSPLGVPIAPGNGGAISETASQSAGTALDFPPSGGGAGGTTQPLTQPGEEDSAAPNLQIVMDADSATVINIGANLISLNDVTFKRVAQDGAVTASFWSENWNRVAAHRVGRFPAGDCYQVRRLGTELRWPSSCDILQGWLATANAGWYFWIPAEEGDAFHILRDDRLVHKCVIPAARCVFYLPPP